MDFCSYLVLLFCCHFCCFTPTYTCLVSYSAVISCSSYGSNGHHRLKHQIICNLYPEASTLYTMYPACLNQPSHISAITQPHALYKHDHVSKCKLLLTNDQNHHNKYMNPNDDLQALKDSSIGFKLNEYAGR